MFQGHYIPLPAVPCIYVGENTEEGFPDLSLPPF